DLLLLAGDLAPVQNHDLYFQAAWLDDNFRSWLSRQPARHIIGIAGNHDLVFERAPHLVPRDLPWTYLQDSGTTWEGFKIWGTPWQPKWCRAQFGPDQSFVSEIRVGSLFSFGLARHQLYSPSRVHFLPLWQGLAEEAHGGTATHTDPRQRTQGTQVL